ncbi:MAG: hypothetical protein AAGA42_11220 [Actinomycetota bacterium]
MTKTANTTTHNIEVGDLFYGSWGYDQTNIDFYEVIRVTAKKVEIQPIRTDVRSESHGTQQVAPLPGTYRDYDVQIQTGRCDRDRDRQRRTKLCPVRPSWKGDDHIIVLNGDHRAYRYTGPVSETAPGWGH